MRHRPVRPADAVKGRVAVKGAAAVNNARARAVAEPVVAVRMGALPDWRERRLSVEEEPVGENDRPVVRKGGECVETARVRRKTRRRGCCRWRSIWRLLMQCCLTGATIASPCRPAGIRC